MRKIIVLLVITLSYFTSFAADVRVLDSRGFEIIGYKNPVMDVYVSPISNSIDNDSGQGMPFYLDEDDVSYDSDGRVIATWAAFSNSDNVTLSITAHPLNPASQGESVNYILEFDYVYTDGNNSIRSDSFSVKSTTESYNISLAGKLGFSDCDIKFRLQDGVDISDSKYPETDYSATVKIMISGEGMQ